MPHSLNDSKWLGAFGALALVRWGSAALLIEETIIVTLDVHFISSLPVKQRPACTAWADKRPAQIVEAES